VKEAEGRTRGLGIDLLVASHLCRGRGCGQ
jgi:hypothetical protein